MSKVEILLPKILKWEGGYVNDPKDKGGATKMGVTISTWRQCGYDKDGDGDIDEQDIKLLSVKDATIVLKRYYWDRWRADELNNQSIANILVDWVWSSGKWGIVMPQRILGLSADGIAGPVTVQAVNNADQNQLFNSIWEARKNFYLSLTVRDSSQRRFLGGWIHRLNDYKFIK